MYKTSKSVVTPIITDTPFRRRLYESAVDTYIDTTFEEIRSDVAVKGNKQLGQVMLKPKLPRIFLRFLTLFAMQVGVVDHVVADDIAPLSDEFSHAATFQNWTDIVEEEGWVFPSYEVADINTTTPGHFHIVPDANTWFAHLRGLLFFKEIEGDFIASAKVRVLSRHNPNDPTEVPNRSFSLTGIFVHGPRTITQAAPNPYTTNAVWPPGDFGSDYVANTENYIFLSYGSAGNPGTRQFEIKATRNSNSRLYYDSTGIEQNQTDAWLQMVRVGNTVVACEA